MVRLMDVTSSQYLDQAQLTRGSFKKTPSIRRNLWERVGIDQNTTPIGPQRRGVRPRMRSKPALITAKRLSMAGSNSLSVKMYGQSFSMASRTNSPT